MCGLGICEFWTSTGVGLFLPPGKLLSGFEPYEITEAPAGASMSSKLQTP